MRQQPADHDAERIVLAYVLANSDDREGSDEVMRGLTDRHFEAPQLRAVAEVVFALRNEGVKLSTSAVATALHESGIAKPTHSELVRLTLDGVAQSAAVVATRRLQELHRWRVLLEIGASFQAAWRNGGATVEQLVSQALTDFEALEHEAERPYVPMDAVLADRVAELKANSGKPVRRVLTRYRPLDELVGGFGDTDLVVLAGATAGGKTAMASQVAEAMAADGRCVLFASAEMAAWELGDRALSRASSVPATLIRDNNLDTDDMARLEQAAKLDAWKRVLVMERDGALTVQRIANTARMVRRHTGLGLVVVDYLQLVTSTAAPNERGRTRQMEVAAVTRGLKNLALDLGVPVLALSQFNRDAVRDGGEPELHHLRESGEIEQAANMVLFVWRHDDDPKEQLRLICKKHRAGSVGKSKRLYWNPRYVSFEGEVPEGRAS